MSNYRVRFGAYDLPASLRPAQNGMAQSVAVQPRPRASGGVSQPGRREPSILRFEGELAASNGIPDTLYAVLDDLTAALAMGKQNLWFARDDRYYRDAQCTAFDLSWGPGGKLAGLFCSVALSFTASDYPEPFAGTPTTVTLGTTGGTLTVLGQAPPLPAWSITIGTGGTGPLTLTNSTTGETAVLSRSGGFASGDVIVLPRDGYVVTRNGVAEFGTLLQRIPSLLPGANTITLSATGTATISALSVSYQARYQA